MVVIAMVVAALVFQIGGNLTATPEEKLRLEQAMKNQQELCISSEAEVFCENGQ